MNEIVVIKDELHYAISLREVLWGGLLLAITMVIHGTGMVYTLRAHHALREKVERFQSFFLGLGILVIAAWMIILVDLIEVLVWSGFYVLSGAMQNPSSAYYYALVNYCTLNSGYLPRDWRLLEGMLGMAGLLTFAWSTGIMVTLAQRFQERHAHTASDKDRGAGSVERARPKHKSDDARASAADVGTS